MRKMGSAVAPVIALDRGADKPLHRQIYEGFRRAILEHQVRPLQQVPSTRALAADLGISRIPILEAYSQLLAEGFLESRVGAGTFVCAQLPVQLVPSRRGNAPRVNVQSARPVSRTSQSLKIKLEPWVYGRGAFAMAQVFGRLMRQEAIPLHVQVFPDRQVAWEWLRPSEPLVDPR